MDYQPPPETFALMCDLRSRVPTREPIDDELLRWLKHSAASDACEIFLDQWQRPIGYVCWAGVDLESLCRLARTGVWPCLPHEWQEGSLALLLDLAICPGSFNAARGQLRAFLRRHPQGAYVRQDLLTLYSLGGGGGASQRRFLVGSGEARDTFSDLEAAHRALPWAQPSVQP